MAKLIYKKFSLNYPIVSYYYRYQEQEYINRLELDDIPEKKLKKANHEILNLILANIGVAMIPHLYNIKRICYHIGNSIIFFTSEFYLQTITNPTA